MSMKASYEELEQRVRELEKKIVPTDSEVALSAPRELFEKIFMSLGEVLPQGQGATDR